jgi:hypothetical protein
MALCIFSKIFTARIRIDKSDRIIVEPHFSAYRAVVDGRALRLDLDLDGCSLGVEQRLRQIITDIGIFCGAYAQTIDPPGFDPHDLMSQVPDKCLILLLKTCQDLLLNRHVPVPIDSSNIQSRVQCVTQAIAKQVESQHGDHDGNAGNEQQVGCIEHIVAFLAQH